MAKDVVALIESRYDCAAAKAANLTGGVGFVKKKVLYISFFSAGFGGYYGVPTCNNSINVWCALVAKAGGELITFPSGAITNHSLFVEQYVSQADVVFYADFNWDAPSQYSPTFYNNSAKAAWENSTVVKTAKVFDPKKVYSNTWFEDR